MNQKSIFLELHVECLTLSTTYTKQKRLILYLENKTKTMQVELKKVKDSTCTKCNYLELKIGDLNKVIKKNEKGQLGLESVLSKQRYTNDISGIGYSNLKNLVKVRLSL